LANRCDIDDAGGSASLEGRQQQASQVEMRQVIDLENQLMAIFAEAPRIIAGASDAGIVDQQMKARMRRLHALRQRLNLLQRPEVAGEILCFARSRTRDVRGDRLAALGVEA